MTHPEGESVPLVVVKLLGHPTAETADYLDVQLNGFLVHLHPSIPYDSSEAITEAQRFVGAALEALLTTLKTAPNSVVAVESRWPL